MVTTRDETGSQRPSQQPSVSLPSSTQSSKSTVEGNRNSAVSHINPSDRSYNDLPTADALAVEKEAPYNAPPTKKSDRKHKRKSVTDSTTSGSSVRTRGTTEAWQIELDEIEFGKKLGEGAFGVVWKGKSHGDNVAIKQLKLDGAGAHAEKAKIEFANEIGHMASIRAHEHLVLFHGVTTLESGDLAAVVEYCAHGSLKDTLYVVIGPNDTEAQIAKKKSKLRDWNDADLVRIAHGAASGLAHLHRLDIIHRDIAARNVLLTKYDVATVADFGMARAMEDGNNYTEQPTSQKVGPIKWMAPEQIERNVYSRASDVFSFGVLLFEIFAREAPWKDVNNMVAASEVIQKKRMKPPKSAPKPLRQLMLDCWSHERKERPMMSAVQQVLAEHLSDQSYSSESS